MDYLEHYRALTSPPAPFDPLLEATGKDNYFDLSAVKQWTGANPMAVTVIGKAETFFRANPTERVFYVRDPKGWLEPKAFAKEAYRMFLPDSNDDEMFADGPGPLGGRWNYEISAASLYGLRDAVEKTPPKPKLEPVQGKTGKGWRITIAVPFQHYKDASDAAKEATAKSLAAEGYYPASADTSYGYAGGPELRAKYYALGQKAKKAGKPFKTEAARSPTARKLADAQAVDMDRLQRLAGIR